VTRVSKSDIIDWAKTEAAEGQLPELIRKLILASNQTIEEIDFSYGDSVGRSGFDGFVRAKAATNYVADGESVWECGRSENYLRKANDDFKKRTARTSRAQQSELTYYCVTPRHWEEKLNWADNPGTEKEKIENRWKAIRVLDVDDLIGWLSVCPGVDAWFSRMLGKAIAGVHDVEGYWKNVATTKDLVFIDPMVLLGGREELAKKVQSFFASSDHRPRIFPIASRSPDEIVPFAVAATVASGNETMVSRTLVVESLDSWRKISQEEGNLCLIVSPRVSLTHVDLQHAATRNHRVIFCAIDGGEQLPRLTRFEVLTSLMSSGVEEAQATQLAYRCGGHGQLLLHSLSGIPTPAGATESKLSNRIKAACLLLYGWDGKNTADRKAFSELCGSAYEEIEDALKNDSRDPNGMLFHADCKFRLLAPELAWTRYSSLIDDSVLNTYERIAPALLTDDDPTAGMSGEERIRSQILGSRREFSNTLRQNVARTLAIVASIGSEQLKFDSTIDPSFVDRIVTKTLKNATFKRWASFGIELSILAEAAPEEQLDALNRDLRVGGSLHEVMQRDNSGFFGSPAHTGVLWALERLCWSSNYLVDAICVLFRLHRVNPGLKSGNNPANSIRETLQFACPQTNADWSVRQEAISKMLEQDAGLAFRIVLSLFPSYHSSWIRRSLPEWRDWGYGYKSGTTDGQIEIERSWCVEQLLSFAADDEDRWCELIALCGSINDTQYDSILERYKAVLDNGDFSQQGKRVLWETINPMLIRMEWGASQRRLQTGAIVCITELKDSDTESEAHFPGDERNFSTYGERLRKLLDASIPEDPVLAGCHAFLGGFNPDNCYQHFPDRFNSQRQRDRILDARTRFIARIWHVGRMAGLLRLAAIEHVDADAVGTALAMSKEIQIRPTEIINCLSSETRAVRVFAHAYFRQWSWDRKDSLSSDVLPLLSKLSSNEAIAYFLQSLPATDEVWDFIDTQNDPIRLQYWKRPRIPWDIPNGRLGYIVRNLIEASRADQGVVLLVRCKESIAYDEIELVFSALESLPFVDREAEDNARDSLNWEIRQLFELLYDAAMSQVERLIGLELLYHEVFQEDEQQRFQPKALLGTIRDEPSLFVNIVKYTSLNDNGESTTLDDETIRISVTQIKGLVFRLAELPGQSDLCPIEGKTFIDWVSHVLQIASEHKCLKSVGRQIIDVMTRTSWRSIETWPDVELANAINHMDNIFPDLLQQRLFLGLSNARGMHCCDPTGQTEDSLSSRISNRASQIRSTCPAASRALRSIANDLKAESKGNVEESEWER
jgi:hypothetical protein